jgi:hypothetical protein
MLHTEAGQHIGLLPAIRQRKPLATAESGSGSLPLDAISAATPMRFGCWRTAGRAHRPFASEDVRRRPGMGAGE